MFHSDTYVMWTAYRLTTSRPTAEQTQQNDENYEENIRNKIMAASLPFVKEYGWSKEAISAGAKSIGYPEIAHGMFTNGGADLIYYFQKYSNQKLVDILKDVQKNSGKSMSRNEFVEKAVCERLKMILPYKSKWPQAIAIMSLPPNVPNALASLLTMVDDICYYAGDHSVDFNWYARRVALAGVYKATELYLIQDSSMENEKTWKFLNRRLKEAAVMHELLCKSEISTKGAKEAVMAAFITARNILGLSWNR